MFSLFVCNEKNQPYACYIFLDIIIALKNAGVNESAGTNGQFLGIKCSFLIFYKNFNKRQLKKYRNAPEHICITMLYIYIHTKAAVFFNEINHSMARFYNASYIFYTVTMIFFIGFCCV